MAISYSPVILIGDTLHTAFYHEALSHALVKYDLILSHYRDMRSYIFNANPLSPAVFLLDVDGLHDTIAVIDAIDSSPRLIGSVHFLLCDDAPICGDCATKPACKKMAIKLGADSHPSHLYQINKNSAPDALARKIQWLAAKVAIATRDID